MDLYVRVGTLIDGTGADPLKRAVVVAKGRRITWVGPEAKAPRPSADQNVIDANNQVLLPGLIDVHCHLFMHGKVDHSIPDSQESDIVVCARGIANAKKWLHLGVTTIRDLACRRNFDVGLRDAINAGVVPGPRIFAHGSPLVMTGGLRPENEDIAITVDTPDEARKAARNQLKAGVDGIKLFGSAGIGGGAGKLVGESGWPQLTEEEMHAAVVEAHKASKPVSIHAISTAAIKNAVRAGTNTVEHGTFLDEEAVSLMKDRGTIFVPTAAINKTLADEGEHQGYPPHIAERARIALEAIARSVRLAFESGIRIGAGSDPVAGDTLAKECIALRKIGLSAMDVVVAATKRGAEIVGAGADLGTVETGKIADLVVLGRDPLTDISALEDAEWVIQGGSVVKSPTTTSTGARM